jgi:hypothetical protein
MHPASLVGGLTLENQARGLEQLIRYGEGATGRGHWHKDLDTVLAQFTGQAEARVARPDAHFGHRTQLDMLRAVRRDRDWSSAGRGPVLGRAVKGQAQALRELAMSSISGRAQ